MRNTGTDGYSYCDGHGVANTDFNGDSYSCTLAVGDTVLSTGDYAVHEPGNHDGQLSLLQQWGGSYGQQLLEGV
jgi:hypothetical protein